MMRWRIARVDRPVFSPSFQESVQDHLWKNLTSSLPYASARGHHMVALGEPFHRSIGVFHENAVCNHSLVLN
jgi:hypothetical protein